MMVVNNFYYMKTFQKSVLVVKKNILNINRHQKTIFFFSKKLNKCLESSIAYDSATLRAIFLVENVRMHFFPVVPYVVILPYNVPSYIREKKDFSIAMLKSLNLLI